MFVRCSLCGKELLVRQPNGLWRFRFGRNKDFVPVEMIIYGSVKMKCMRRSCRRENPRHWNIFNIFPHQNDFQQSVNESDRTNQPAG